MAITKVAAIGSRGYSSLDEVFMVLDAMKKTIEAGANTMEVVSGGCDGVDKKVEEWCRAKGVKLIIVPAEGDLDDGAGKKRNGKLLEGVNVLAAFWDGTSENTLDAIIRSHKLKTVETRVFVR